MEKLSSKARIAEVAGVGAQLVRLYGNSASVQDEVFLRKLISEIDAQAQGLLQAINKEVVLSELEQADKKRSEYIRMLGKMVAAYEVFPLEDIKENGGKLAKVFGKTGTKIGNENYLTKTSLIDALLLDLNEQSIKPVIEQLLGIDKAIELLTNSQREFKELQRGYQDAQIKKEAEKTASELKKPLSDIINLRFMPYLYAIQMANPQKYNTFVIMVEKVLSDANASIKTRLKTKK